MGQFRRGDANDPATYVASVASVLSRYPREIVTQITDPRTGLALIFDWLPTIKQVSDECDRLSKKTAGSSRRDEIIHETLADRAKFEEKVKPSTRSPELIGKPSRCNLLFRHDSPGFTGVCERALREPQDAWRTSDGIWVPLDWKGACHVY